MPEREPERLPVALVAAQQLVVVLDEQVAVAGLEDRRGRPGERRQLARRAPQRRHVMGQAGRCRQPEAAAGVGRQVVQPAGQLAAPRQRPPRLVVGADAELEPGVAGERRPPLAVGPRPPGELPALTRRHRAQLAPLFVDAAYQHVRRLSAAADAQRDEQAGGAAVDERGRLRAAQAGRERADFGGAQRPVRFDPHPRDAAVRGDPRAAAARRHEEANGAREAGAEVRVLRLERALPDPAVEQAAGADDQHAVALDRQEGAARRGYRRLAGAEALGQRIGHPAPPFEALDPDVDEVADAAAAQQRPQHAVAALPHRQVRAGRRQAVHAIAVEDGDLADLAVTDEQAAGRAAGRVEGPRFDQPVGRRQEAPVGVVRLLSRGGPHQGDRGQQHEDRARGEGPARRHGSMHASGGGDDTTNSSAGRTPRHRARTCGGGDRPTERSRPAEEAAAGRARRGRPSARAPRPATPASARGRWPARGRCGRRDGRRLRPSAGRRS